MKAFILPSISYEKGISLQNYFRNKVLNGFLEYEVLLLLEHDKVITLGRFAKRENIVASQSVLNQRNIRVIETDRGGDVTYHGPGQLVVYPIFNIRNMSLTIPEYIFKLEQSIIMTLSAFGLNSNRLKGFPGVWINDKKIASIGVSIKRGVTMHGTALNVSTDLSDFQLINACGLGKPVTSIKNELNSFIPLSHIIPVYLQKFSQVFNVNIFIESISKLGDLYV